MHKVFLGLGSNVGKKEENINKAIQLLQSKIKIVKIAPFYISKAVGYENQENFINTAILGYTNLSPVNLLEFVKDVERNVGRIYRFHWGPREIDIDILFFDDLVIKLENLEIPHPRILERDFVLIPLLDLDKDIIHPVFNRKLKDFIKQLKIKSIIRKVD